MWFVNGTVGWILRSPLHGLLSGSTDLVRFTGQRSGRTITTPTQYARDGDSIVIMAGRPDTKSWWRNFTDERDLDVLVRRRWLPMRGLAWRGDRDPEQVRRLLPVYLGRFPKAARSLPDDPDERVRAAVFVECRPR